MKINLAPKGKNIGYKPNNPKAADGKFDDLNPHSKVLCGSTGATRNGRVRTGTRTLWAEPQEKFLRVPSFKRFDKCSAIMVVKRWCGK